MIAFALSAALALQAPEQFDLVCSGTITRGQGRGQAFETRIRLDLGAKRWCDGDCERVRDIHEVTAAVITLDRVEPAAQGLRITSWTTIDRTTGAYDRFSSVIGAATDVSQRVGQCEPAAFSGMPAARF